MMKFKILISSLFALLLISGCNSYKIKKNITPEERFELAKRMYKNEDYFEAKNQLKILTLNNPGISFIDETQFLLAECHFNMEEYILAADEYNRLIRLYPRSEWIDDAQFKIALCHFKLSPKPALDQKYTIQAVEHLQLFIEDFPNSDLIPEAEKLLHICREKLAEKEFKSGNLYRKLDHYYAALVYFDSVLNNYYDSNFADNAMYWKGECEYKLNRKQEALNTFLTFVSKYPKNEHVTDARKRIKKINDELENTSNTNGVSKLEDKNKNE